MAKLGFGELEVMRMTFAKFIRLYNQYKTCFDLEMKLHKKDITYAELEERNIEYEAPDGDNYI